ncbi:hypothetical protein UCDDA912_g10297 [Diaporthe ampelina]|uniref:Uncharacterized protein n=1 Tax=Diaporthe ampelina TaxID=1214573 RepID=A0A0G2F6B9_9PEZI|nr:hypothetical protein UCDDA912_g10297 [Diaporthe ampelina]
MTENMPQDTVLEALTITWFKEKSGHAHARHIRDSDIQLCRSVVGTQAAAAGRWGDVDASSATTLEQLGDEAVSLTDRWKAKNRSLPSWLVHWRKKANGLVSAPGGPAPAPAPALEVDVDVDDADNDVDDDEDDDDDDDVSVDVDVEAARADNASSIAQEQDEQVLGSPRHGVEHSQALQIDDSPSDTSASAGPDGHQAQLEEGSAEPTCRDLGRDKSNSDGDNLPGWVWDSIRLAIQGNGGDARAVAAALRAVADEMDTAPLWWLQTAAGPSSHDVGGSTTTATAAHGNDNDDDSNNSSSSNNNPVFAILFSQAGWSS